MLQKSLKCNQDEKYKLLNQIHQGIQHIYLQILKVITYAKFIQFKFTVMTSGFLKINLQYDLQRDFSNKSEASANSNTFTDIR